MELKFKRMRIYERKTGFSCHTHEVSSREGKNDCVQCVQGEEENDIRIKRRRKIFGSNCFYFVIWLNSSRISKKYVYAVCGILLLSCLYIALGESLCLITTFWKKNDEREEVVLLSLEVQWN